MLLSISYNFYRQGKWQALDSESQDYERSFGDMVTLAGDENDGKFAFTTEGFEREVEDDTSRPIILRGAVNSNRKALPAPSGTRLFTDAQEIEAIEANSLGSLLAINADAVVDIEIWPNGEVTDREIAPIQRVRNDKLIPGGVAELTLPVDNYVETDAIQKIANDLDLVNLSDEDKIETLKDFFWNNFKYTTHLSIDDRQPLTGFSPERARRSLLILRHRHDPHHARRRSAESLCRRFRGQRRRAKTR